MLDSNRAWQEWWAVTATITPWHREKAVLAGVVRDSPCRFDERNILVKPARRHTVRARITSNIISITGDLAPGTGPSTEHGLN